MKKYIAIGLCAVCVVGLVACSQQAQQEPAEPEQSQGVQHTEPVTTPSTEPTETVTAPSQEPATQPTEVNQGNETAGEVKTLGEEQHTEEETGTVDEVGPDDEVGTVEEVEPVEEEPEIQLYTDCNETVYATGQVNIRESWSVSSTKLGSLSWGESVTRTGKPIAGTEAEGWSRVQLSNGSTAYIASSYLSTSKPVAQTPAPSTSTQTQTQPQDYIPGLYTGEGSPFTLWDPYAGLTEEEKAAAIKEAQEGIQHAIDETTGVLYPGGQKP